MVRRASADELLTSTHPLLDVRSPGEYAHGHIPGAISFPLFSDEERARIGTLYKQTGRDEAFEEGLRVVGPKMAGFVQDARDLGASAMNIYCWRGGMRSNSMAWLLEQAGFEVSVLDGGYKRYRGHLMSFFESPLDLRILTGLTGSGKTAVLHALQDQGAQVIDLEGIANHKGSSFGNVLTAGQPTTEQFQNDLFEAFMGLDIHRPIWVEDESIAIGGVYLPQPLFARMRTSPHVLLEVDDDQRLDLLVEDYGQLAPARLKEATANISKKLGLENMRDAHAAIDDGDLRRAASIILRYYDRMYRKSIGKKTDRIEATVDGRGLGPSAIANKIMKTHGD